MNFGSVAHASFIVHSLCCSRVLTNIGLLPKERAPVCTPWNAASLAAGETLVPVCSPSRSASWLPNWPSCSSAPWFRSFRLQCPRQRFVRSSVPAPPFLISPLNTRSRPGGCSKSWGRLGSVLTFRPSQAKRYWTRSWRLRQRFGPNYGFGMLHGALLRLYPQWCFIHKAGGVCQLAASRTGGP